MFKCEAQTEMFSIFSNFTELQMSILTFKTGAHWESDRKHKKVST